MRSAFARVECRMPNGAKASLTIDMGNTVMHRDTYNAMSGPPPSTTETACYLVCTLALAYLLAFLFVFTGERHDFIIQALMCVPGLLALTFMWGLHREPPRAVGFAFTGWGPWVFALLFPLGFEVV